MGITIHLQGRLRSVTAVPQLVAEVSVIAETQGWSCDIIDDEDLSGICFAPHPECESLRLLFDREGILRNAVLLGEEGSQYVAVETQYAPAAAAPGRSPLASTSPRSRGRAETG